VRRGWAAKGSANRGAAGNEVALGYLLNGDTKQARPAIHQRRSLSNDSRIGRLELSSFKAGARRANAAAPVLQTRCQTMNSNVEGLYHEINLIIRWLSLEGNEIGTSIAFPALIPRKSGRAAGIGYNRLQSISIIKESFPERAEL